MPDRTKMIARIAEIQEELRKLGVRDIEFFVFREMSDDQIIEEGKALRAQLERKKKSSATKK